MGLPGGGDSVEDIILDIRVRTRNAAAEIRNFAKSSADEIRSGIKPAADEAADSVTNIGTTGQVALGSLLAGAITTVIGLVTRLTTALGKMAVDFISQGVQMNASIQTMAISLTSMLGSEEKALAFMDKMRRMAAATGQDPNAFIMTGRSMLPYAEGDIAALEQMLVLAQQLAVADPFAGMIGANRALREALSGNYLSLANIFDLNRTRLKELTEEYRRTGDTAAYVAALQQEVGRQTGITADQIAATGDTFVGKLNQVKFFFSELQRVASAPIFTALQRQLAAFAGDFQTQMPALKDMALSVGAGIAVAIDFIGSMVKSIYDAANAGVIAWTGIADQLNTLKEFTVRVLGSFSEDAIRTAVTFINGMLDVVNSGLRQLGIQEIGRINADQMIADLQQSLQSASSSISLSLQQITAPFTEFGGMLADAFNDYREQFAGLLEYDESALDGMSSQHRDFEEVDVEQWQKYVTQIGDIIQEGNQRREKALQDHLSKMQKVNDQEREATDSAYAKAAEDRAKVEEDYNTRREEITADVSEKLQDIEQEHAKRIKQIRTNVEDELFDAVNARDARRVYEILRKSRQETQQAEVDRKEREDKTRKEADKELGNLQKQRADRLATIQKALEKELRMAADKAVKERMLENQAYQQQLRDIASGINQRLQTLARAWVEEGNLTAQGAQSVLQIAARVYGPSGAYIQMYDAFNAALMDRVRLTNAILTQQQQLQIQQQQATITTTIQQQPGRHPGWVEPIMMQTGGSFLVNRPTPMVVGEGFRPERVTVTPLGQPGFGAGSRLEDSSGLPQQQYIILDVRGVSREFEAAVVNTVADKTAAIVRGRNSRHLAKGGRR